MIFVGCLNLTGCGTHEEHGPQPLINSTLYLARGVPVNRRERSVLNSMAMISCQFKNRFRCGSNQRKWALFNKRGGRVGWLFVEGNPCDGESLILKDLVFLMSHKWCTLVIQ